MTRTTISVNLHDTDVHSKCEPVVAGKIPEFCASLRWDSCELELFGTLDQIDDALEDLLKDVACLRAQQEQKNAGTAGALRLAAGRTVRRDAS